MKRIVILLLVISLIPLTAALAMRPAPPENFDALRLSLGQSPDFVAEYHNLKTYMTDSGFWKTEDYNGRYYHFRDGERATDYHGSLPISRRTIWIFGNSGFQDPWIADGETAADKLAALVRGYRIANRSSGGQHIAGQLAWLRETPVRHGDIVIFIDGAMDAPAGPQSVVQVLNDAQVYTQQRGAFFLHLRQPYIDPSFVSAMPGSPINIPRDGFIESAHLNEHGAAMEALQIYNAITIY